MNQTQTKVLRYAAAAGDLVLTTGLAGMGSLAAFFTATADKGSDLRTGAGVCCALFLTAAARTAVGCVANYRAAKNISVDVAP